MQTQTIMTPTDNDIRRNDQAAQETASREFYMREVERLLDMIERIGQVARAGEMVVLVDRWGERTELVQYSDGEN